MAFDFNKVLETGKAKGGELLGSAKTTAEVMKQKGIILDLERQIKAEFTKLGEAYYNEHSAENYGPYQEIMDRVEELKLQIDKAQEEIKNIEENK